MTSGTAREARRVLPAGRRLKDDEAGAFLVLEAILVALLVLTAILFFTSIQRPSTGQAGSGGLDLAQVSADTLDILKARTFTVATGSPNAGTLTFEQWMSNLAVGDSATATVIDTFLRQVLPTGTNYQLRFDNGVGRSTLLPLTATSLPQNARGSEIMFTPAWATFEVKVPTASGSYTTYSAAPLEPVLATNVLSRFTDPGDILCIKPPNAASTGTIGSVGPGTVAWKTLWQPTAAQLLGTRSGGNKQITGLSSTALLDVGMHVSGTGIPAGATIASIDSTTQVTLAASSNLGASSNTAVNFYTNRVPAGAPYGIWAGYTDAGCLAGETFTKVIPPACSMASPPSGCTSDYAPYGLQLVVWFGA